MRVRGHTLVWGRQLPPWLEEGTWTPGELRQILVDHVRTEVGHFRGVQQGFSRNTAAVQAGAAELVLLDQGDVQTELSRP